jgi:starvation-inducible DNA-binding protein
MTKQGKDKSAETKVGRRAAGAAGIHIGISDEDRAAIAKGLSRLLADTYTLYLTTHNFHWNVTGPMFNTLHTMFMAQYTELWNAVDPIAERIRSLGHHARLLPSSASSPACPMPRPAAQGPGDGAHPGAGPRGRGAHGSPAVPTCRQGRRRAHGRSADPASDVHEQTAWMLRSLLEE